jgi:hypothetical protein
MDSLIFSAKNLLMLSLLLGLTWFVGEQNFLFTYNIVGAPAPSNEHPRATMMTLDHKIIKRKNGK